MSEFAMIPLDLRDANSFVNHYHRHHKPTVGHKFSLGAVFEGNLVGVVIVGRPVARMLDDGLTLEVNRLTTDGTPNACSFLYSKARKAAIALGYTKLLTYILESENGASPKASGWKQIRETAGGSWSTEKRPRKDKHPLEPKLLWEAEMPPTNAQIAAALKPGKRVRVFRKGHKASGL